MLGGETDFSVWIVLYTAIGATVFWGKWGRSKLQVFALSWLLDEFDIPKKPRIIVEFLIFLVLGCIVAIGVAQPASPIQAITAGFGWTGLFARLPSK